MLGSRGTANLMEARQHPAQEVAAIPLQQLSYTLRLCRGLVRSNIRQALVVWRDCQCDFFRIRTYVTGTSKLIKKHQAKGLLFKKSKRADATL